MSHDDNDEIEKVLRDCAPLVSEAAPLILQSALNAIKNGKAPLYSVAQSLSSLESSFLQRELIRLQREITGHTAQMTEQQDRFVNHVAPAPKETSLAVVKPLHAAKNDGSGEVPDGEKSVR